MTTTQKLAEALRRIVDTGPGGKDYGRALHADAVRDGITALAEYEAPRPATVAGSWREDADITATFEDGREETVIELTNADHSETFAYALPEHARRIVACVNACEGSSTADLESGNYGIVRTRHEYTKPLTTTGAQNNEHDH